MRPAASRPQGEADEGRTALSSAPVGHNMRSSLGRSSHHTWMGRRGEGSGSGAGGRWGRGEGSAAAAAYGATAAGVGAATTGVGAGEGVAAGVVRVGPR